MASSFCLSSVHFQVGQLRYNTIYFVLTGTCAHACLAKFRPYKQLAKAEVAHQMASLLPRAHAQRGKVIGSVVVVVVVVVHTKIARSRILGEFASTS